MHTHAAVTVHGDPVPNQANHPSLRSGVSGAVRCAGCDGIPALVVMPVCVIAGEVESGGGIVPGVGKLHEQSRISVSGVFYAILTPV